jgi:hypothetical protein
MSNYTWTTTTGGYINSGQGTNTIQVLWTATGPQSVSVNFTDASGCSAPAPAILPVTVNPLPDPAGGISGSLMVCAGATGIAYSVLPIADALTYIWTLPLGDTIASGDGTNYITVDFGLNASSGNITVYGNNTCGNGTTSPPFPVTVNPIPQPPVITPDALMAGDTIFSSIPAGNQWYINLILIPGATGQFYITDSMGVYMDIVTVNGCSSLPSNNVYANGVGISEKQSGSFNIFPVPNDGMFKLSINSRSKQTFTLDVYNYLGVVIFELKNIEVKGLSERMIHLRASPNGVYSIVLKNNEMQMVKKIVINK